MVNEGTTCDFYVGNQTKSQGSLLVLHFIILLAFLSLVFPFL